MQVSQTEIASLVSQTGDEYFALLLFPVAAPTDS